MGVSMTTLLVSASSRAARAYCQSSLSGKFPHEDAITATAKSAPKATVHGEDRRHTQSMKAASHRGSSRHGRVDGDGVMPCPRER